MPEEIDGRQVTELRGRFHQKEVGYIEATKLKRIVCGCRQEYLNVEGFYGDYGNVQPKWFYPE